MNTSLLNVAITGDAGNQRLYNSLRVKRYKVNRPRITSIITCTDVIFAVSLQTMITRIGIIGPESTAKSTLSRDLAAWFGGTYVAEYAREYIEELGRPYTYADVEVIAREQIREVERFGGWEVGKLVFFDTELIITKVWFEHKYQRCPDFLLEALERNPIDFYLLCAPDLPFEPDPLRENPHLREYLFEWYEREVQAQKKPYAIIRGVGPERLQGAIEAMQAQLVRES